MKKIITLLGICIFLPACTLDLAGDPGTSTGFDPGGTGISVDTGLNTGFKIGDDSGFIGTIGDGKFAFGDGKLF